MMGLEAADRPTRSRSWGRALAAALFAALSRPAAWPVALAGFLVRGGVLVFLLPIVEFPTTPQLQNFVAPLITPIAYGAPPTGLLVLIGAVILALLGWLVVSGLVGAGADVALVAEALAADELDPPEHRTRGTVVRAVVVRLLAYLPLALALAWGTVPIVQATYAQLISPDEISTPLVVRVLLNVPAAVALVVVTWLVGETVGGLAERRLVLSSDGVPGALAWAVGWVVRHPLGAIATLLITAVTVALTALPAAIAAGVARSTLAGLLEGGQDRTSIALALLALIVLWLAGLTLTAAATTFRAFAWTLESARGREVRGSADRPGVGDRTIGDAGTSRPGEWPAPHASGRL